ncbi:Histone-lysine N-methyltransferase [Morus notabilis]|uniref:Histone-lysine N-methyltransferase n=1 Tax=Morus notabilis TaxID=981085 RepID=W9RT47_9ROSA|nr:Histone-lysine N-methyltransferase [Morus notabilis]
MVDDPVTKALNVTRALGIPDEEVKPILKNLLRVYDKNWTLIEEGNYRTLLDAYFDHKETMGKEDKSRRYEGHDESGRPVKRQNLAGKEVRASPTLADPSEESDSEVRVLPLTTPRQGIMKSSKPCSSGSRLESKALVLRGDKKTKSLRELPAGPMNEPSVPSEVHKKGLTKLSSSEKQVNDLALSKKPVLAVHPVSPGLSKSLTSKKSKDDSSASNHSRIIKTTLNIASSSMGEVKILLDWDSALGQPNFQKPKFGEVLKFVENKYVRSYNIVGDQFSVKKLLKDLCESYLKMGTNSTDRSFAINHPSEVIKETGDGHALHVAEQKKRPLNIGFGATGIKGKGSSSSEYTDSHTVTYDEKRPFNFLNDITKGTEKVKISLVDDIGNETLPKFNYIPQNVIYQNANINISLARIVDDDCCSSCSGDCLSSSITCACACETGGEFAYTPQGLLKEDFLRACMAIKYEPQQDHFVYCKDCPLEKAKNDGSPEQCKGHLIRKFIKECWRKCGCDMQCGNRVVQRGISCKLQVFLTRERKGWGLRPLEALPKGTFVCEYVGEVLTNTELYDRNMGISKERHTYPVTLDADWSSEGILRDEEALCLDATFNGNVARFINHRCFDANLVDIPVEVETPDRHYYHLAFFTAREVAALEELTWDYGIDFDDIDHPIEAFSCSCGSEMCRDKKTKKYDGKNACLKSPSFATPGSNLHILTKEFQPKSGGQVNPTS